MIQKWYVLGCSLACFLTCLISELLPYYHSANNVCTFFQGSLNSLV